jgi:glycosyltransferase involved in cell wall biosynthesis
VSLHLFINACGASAGGGVTYLENVLPHLAARPDMRATVLVSSDVVSRVRVPERVELLPLPEGRLGTAGRFLREQVLVPGLIRRCGADVLLSAGNFAVLRAPVPQILLSRNALYTSRDFSHDLIRRRRYGLWLDTKIRASLAKNSVRRADCTVAPSAAFAEELLSWAGRPVRVVHHGFDRALFFADPGLSPALSHVVERSADTVRLLFISHYNYYRNFETLLRAVAILRQRLSKKIQLIVTCKLEGTPGGYDTREAAGLVRSLAIENEVVQLGPVPYSQLHHLYRSCDVYVTSAYAESFAHPLVEAMSCGLPVVASDLPVHREICRDAALYFPRFSPEGLADHVAQLTLSPGLSETLARRGQIRAQDFSWEHHVDEIVAIARELMGSAARLRTSDTFQGAVQEVRDRAV